MQSEWGDPKTAAMLEAVSMCTKRKKKLDMNFGGVADLFDQTLYYIQCQKPDKKIVKVPQKTDQTHRKL